MHEIKAKADEKVLKLLYYFIVEQGYNLVVVHGSKDEVWLEKLGADYNVIRIASHYIHNSEQLEQDYYKTSHVVNHIRKKTFLINIKVLNVFTNVNEDLEVDSQVDNIVNVDMRKFNDIYHNQLVIDAFPDIKKKTKFMEKGEQLLMKISNEINQKNLSEARKSEEIFSNNFPFVTYTIIAVNVLLFFAMYVFGGGSTNTQTLINFGASYPPLIEAGEYFRLLTSGFLHIGIMHLLFNNYFLYIIGPQIENFFGRIKYVIIYLGTIIFASLMSMPFFDGVSAGASGAIFGLLGAILYFGYHHRAFLGNFLQSFIIPLIVINLLIGFTMPGINNAAHIGGLIGGVLLAAVVGIKYKTDNFERINAVVMTIIFTGFLIFLSFFN